MRRHLAGFGYDSTTVATVQMMTATGLALMPAPFTSLGPVGLTMPIVILGIVASQGLLERFRRPTVAVQ